MIVKIQMVLTVMQKANKMIDIQSGQTKQKQS